MTDDHRYGIGPAITRDLPVIRADNEQSRQRNIEHEQQYRQAIDRLNRTTDSEINQQAIEQHRHRDCRMVGLTSFPSQAQ